MGVCVCGSVRGCAHVCACVCVCIAMTAPCRTAGLTAKVLKRTVKLFVIGLLTQGTDFPALQNSGINLKVIRTPGILQRIAWAYLVVSMIAIYVPKMLPDYARVNPDCEHLLPTFPANREPSDGARARGRAGERDYV